MKSQKGFAHVLLMLLLMVGLVAAVYLVGQQTNFFPKASAPKSLSGTISGPINTPTPASASASIKVTAPNGGEQIIRGQTYRITWNFFGVQKVVIQSKDEKGWLRGVSGTIINQGYYDWKTQGEYMGPNESAKKIKIKITQINPNGRAGVSDESDNYFTLLKATPTSVASASAKRVFVTSTTYNGNLGGLAGADAKCQTAANNAKLGGAWKAWLSDSHTSAASRLNHSTTPYKLLNNTIIAGNWAELTSGILRAPIDKNEFNAQQTGFTWTNTRINGSVSVGIYTNSCNDFTSNGYATVLHSGFAGYKDQSWTDRTIRTACNIPMILYCFEQ